MANDKQYIGGWSLPALVHTILLVGLFHFNYTRHKIKIVTGGKQNVLKTPYVQVLNILSAVATCEPNLRLAMCLVVL